MQAREAGLVIISIGDNDTVYDQQPDIPRLTIDQYATNIEKMIEIAKGVTDNIVCLGLKQVTEKKVQPVPWNDKVNYCNASIKAYDARLKQVASQKEVSYLCLLFEQSYCLGVSKDLRCCLTSWDISL